MGLSRQIGCLTAQSSTNNGRRRHNLLAPPLTPTLPIEHLERRQLLAATDPIISEFLANNNNNITDEDGDHSDWIEIYNPASTPINLAGWHLTDDPNDLDKWTFPDTPLDADAFLKVFASDKRRAIPGQPLHTNFKLDADNGEYLALVKPDLTVSFHYAPKFPTQVQDVSYGLGPALITNTTLVSTGAPAHYLLPADDSLALTWTQPFFDTSNWASAITPLGFQYGTAPNLPAEIEPNNSIAAANSATSNFSPYTGNLYHLSLQGNISSTTESDYFKIGALQPGDIISISSSGSPSSRGTLANPRVDLYRGLTRILSEYDSGPGNDALIARYLVPADGAGDYYVRARGESASGTYQLGIWLENAGAPPITTDNVVQETEPNNSIDAANNASSSWRAVQYRSLTTGSISTTSDADFFAYQFTKDDRVTINIDSTSTLDAKVSLYNSAGTLIASEDGSSSFPSPYDKDSPIYAFLIPTSGVYYVQVQSASGTGAYAANVYLSTTVTPPLPSGWNTYGGKIATNIGPQMKDASPSVYMRMTFPAIDPNSLSSLKLNIDYDDGFVAYINGTLVASRNAPDPLSLASAATASHQASGPEVIDLTPFAYLLLPEDNANVLAIHGLNVAADDPDFIIAAELLATSTIAGSPQYFANPTPGLPNQPGALGIVADTQFDHDRGFYDAPFDLVISSATPGAQIRYTTDGSEPTPTTGIIYSAPIHITKTTTLRAAAFKPGYLSTNSDTQSYLFLNDILAQDGSGLPQTWGQSGVVGGPDYAINPAIVAANSSTIHNDMKSVPIVSLVTTMDNWFAPNGVGIYPQGVAIERPVSFEYFNPDGSNAIQANAGIQIIGGGIGGTSADRWKSYKLSMRVVFKQIYGPGNIDHDIYGPNAANEFDTLVLDAHLNHTWTHAYDKSQRDTARYLTDTFVSDSQLAMGGAGPHSRFVHLYLNGIYWGMYDLHERPDEHFAADYFGGLDENYYVVKHGIQYGTEAVVSGDPTTVIATYQDMLNLLAADLTVLANYQKVQKVLDIDQFIQYMIANHYAGNLDWANKNWYATYNAADPSGLWRFHSWDAEHTLEGLNDNVLGSSGDAGHPRGIHARLALSPEYRIRFADLLQQYFLTPGGPFYVDPANPNWNPDHPELNVPASRYYARMMEIDRAIIGESARWGDNYPGSNYTRENWLATQNAMLNGYFPQRSNLVLGQYRTASLYPTIAAPAFSQLGGEFPQPYTLSITKVGSGTIYYTTDGSDPRLTGGTLNPKAIIYSAPINISSSTRIRARLLDGSTWSALTEAAFIIGPPPTLRVSEIMYHPLPPSNSPFLADDYEFIELQNIGSNVLYPGKFILSGGINATFAITQQLEPEDKILLVYDIEAFQERYGSAIPIAGTYQGHLANAGDRILLTTEFGQVIQDFTFKDGWFGITDGQGYSIVAINPAASNQILSTKDGWRPSYNLLGNPNARDLGYNPDSIVINEVLSHPSNPQGDWIELFNTTNKDIDISGWFLSDSQDDLQKYKIQPGTKISKNGFLLFTRADHFGNPADPGALRTFGLDAANGDHVYLSSAVANALGGYRESAHFGPADIDVSFGRYIKTSTGKTDFVALSYPTPNQPNAYPKVGPVVINEIMYSPPTGKHEFIELRNITSSDVPLFDPANPANTWQFTDGISFAFANGDSIPANGYALLVNIPPDSFRSTYNIPQNVPVFGPYSGLLENNGERLELSKPGTPQPDGFVPLIRVDHLSYNNTAPWPNTADATGASIGRLVSSDYANDPANWVAIPDGGNPGAANQDEPPTATINPVTPNPRSSPLPSITITFSEPIIGFSLANLTLARNGQPLSFTSQTLTENGLSYTLADLNTLTWLEGTYTLTLNPAGITDLAGNPLAPPPTETFTVTTTSPPAANPADTFYFRLNDPNVEIFHNCLPPNPPTTTLPASQLTSLNLSLGNYLINADLASLSIRVAGQDPHNPVSLTFNTPQHLNSLTIENNALVRLTPAGNHLLQTNALTISHNAILDLADNDLIVHTNSPATVLAQLFNWIKSGRNNGDWNGNGIASSNATDSTGLGIAPQDASVLVKYTWNGDANLDGLVNADDYFLIDSGFISQHPGYHNGDLNYDGAVNADDYFLIDSSFITQSAPLAYLSQPPQTPFATGKTIAFSQLNNLAWLHEKSNQSAFA